MYLKFIVPGNRYSTGDGPGSRSRHAAFLQDAREVEDLLKQLEEVNRKLEAIVYNKAGGSSNEHTLRRYHDVLKDYNHEFHRVRELVEKQMERLVLWLNMICINSSLFQRRLIIWRYFSF